MPSDNQALLLQVSADIRGLEKQFARAQGIVDKGSRRMVASVEAANENVAQKLSRGLGAGIGNNIRNFAAQAGIAGDALGALGPAGLAAAAGIVALGAAFGAAVKASKFADDIADTANRLSVTTDALQEYRFAIHALGGEYEDADKALENFAEKFGAAHAQLTKKAAKPFEALGLDATKFKTTEAALVAVTDKISQLSSTAEQAAIAEKLGLTPLLPALRAGTAEIDKAREAAHRLGFVMDADVVKKGGEAADKLEDLSQVLKVQVNSALVDLTPVILDLATAFAQVARAVGELGRFLDALNNWGPSKALTDIMARAGNMGAAAGAKLGTDRFGQTQFGQSISRFLGGGTRAPSVTMAQLQAAMNAPAVPRTGRLIGVGDGSSSGGGGGRATPRDKGPVFDLPASIRAYEDWLDYRAAEDKRYNDQKALDFMAGVQKAFDLSDVTNDLVLKVSEDFTQAAQDFHDSVADAVAGGLDAGIRGGLPGILEYLTQRFQRSLVDSLANSFADKFASSGSGSGGFLGSALGALVGSRRFAGGTNYAPGGLSLVGERGAELVKLPGGSQVIPNDILRSMGQAGGSSRTFAPQLTQQIHFHGGMTSADRRQTLRQASAAAMREMAAARRQGF